jgi:hypothetical protein
MVKPCPVSAPTIGQECSIARTLTVGAPRMLSVEMMEQDNMEWTVVPGTAVDFELCDGSMFVLACV